MARRVQEGDFRDCYAYDGSTTIEHTRLLDGEPVWRDWLLFDSIEDAEDYYNLSCCS